MPVRLGVARVGPDGLERHDAALDLAGEVHDVSAVRQDAEGAQVGASIVAQERHVQEPLVATEWRVVVGVAGEAARAVGAPHEPAGAGPGHPSDLLVRPAEGGVAALRECLLEGAEARPPVVVNLQVVPESAVRVVQRHRPNARVPEPVAAVRTLGLSQPAEVLGRPRRSMT